MWTKITDSIWEWLLFMTNNQKIAKKDWQEQEKLFDIAFFVIQTITAIIAFFLYILAVYMYLVKGSEKIAWALIFITWGMQHCISEYIANLDLIRHNRSWDE